MSRRYLSLAFPVAIVAALGMLYAHYQQARAHTAAPKVKIKVFNPKQIPPNTKVFAAPKRAPVRQPAADALAAPEGTVPPADARPLTPEERRRLVRECCPPRRVVKVPENRDELQTPFLVYLYDQLEAVEGGTDEERNELRLMIYEADVELRDALGEGALRKIREANMPKVAFRVEHPRKRRIWVEYRPDPDPVRPENREPRDVELNPAPPPADPVRPLPPPAVPPANDPFQDDPL